MVNTTIVSRYKGPLPAANADRVIQQAPLYQPDEVVELLREIESRNVLLWSKKCTTDVAKLDLSVLQVAALVRQAVVNGSYLQSEWCESRPGGPWAACDAYTFKQQEWNKAADKNFTHCYYLKFCIGASGKIMIVASCHLEETRRKK